MSLNGVEEFFIADLGMNSIPAGLPAALRDGSCSNVGAEWGLLVYFTARRGQWLLEWGQPKKL